LKALYAKPNLLIFVGVGNHTLWAVTGTIQFFRAKLSRQHGEFVAEDLSSTCILRRFTSAVRKIN